MHAVTIKLIKLEYYEKGSTLACCGRNQLEAVIILGGSGLAG